MKKILIILIMLVFVFGCSEEKICYLEELENEYVIYIDEKIDFKEIIKTDSLIINTNSENILIENNVVLGVARGEAEIEITVKKESKRIKIIVKEEIDFVINDITLYKGETKNLDIQIIKGDIEDLILEKENDNINIINNERIEALKVGSTVITARICDVVKEVMVIIKDWEIDIINENLTVDIFETLELEFKCPEVCKDMLNIEVYKEEIIRIEDNIVYPLKEGNTRVKVQIGDNQDYTVNFMINVTLDPIEIIKMVHNEEALMKKEINLYGGSVSTQALYGSVSRYMFSNLNLVKSIIDIYENPYVGMVATKEIVEALDRKGYPRSGVKTEVIQYITYHDTGNNAAAANALANAKWMTNQYSVTTSARSWHYTVDEHQVIQSIPDDEITWQGDHYDAYTKSIGIETCVNEEANMNVIWHRMGKLCAQLMIKYNLEIKDIKQHYDWSQKNCPQTLRRNGLYPYAISLVEAELLIKKYLSNYTLNFKSLNPEYVDNTGQIIKAPNQEILVGYTVTITNNKGYNESVTLYTKIGTLK